jgi:hypothetical protein
MNPVNTIMKEKQKLKLLKRIKVLMVNDIDN